MVNEEYIVREDFENSPPSPLQLIKYQIFFSDKVLVRADNLPNPS